MDCPNPLYPALTATRQLSGSPDGLTGAAKRDDTLMRAGVRHAADIFARKARFTTRFRGVSDPKTGEASLFVTRVAGMEARDNKSYGARTLDEALEQHELIVQKILRTY
jgi:hypothetical protein